MSIESDDLDRSARRMKTDWNERARENAHYYIASTEFSSEDEFRASGRRDVALFFKGLEELLHPGQLVLDLGCGIGRMDEVLAPLVEHVTGVDVSSEMVERARDRLAGLSNVRFVEVSGRDLAPIPDNSVALLFSHIVFQHIPKDAVCAYVADAYRVLAPGGHLIFQVIERSPESPPDPPASDTFGLRYYTTDEITRLLEHLQYREISFARLAGSEKATVAHLRVSARTQTVIEKMADLTDPTDLELEEWAYTWHPTAPEGWIESLIRQDRGRVFLSFAADPACGQRDWFLRGLYGLAAEISSPDDHQKIAELTRRAIEHHGHPWVCEWANEVESSCDGAYVDFESWKDGNRAHRAVVAFLEDGRPTLSERIAEVVARVERSAGAGISISVGDLIGLLSGASSPRIIRARLDGSVEPSAIPELADGVWFAWRRAIREAT